MFQLGSFEAAGSWPHSLRVVYPASLCNSAWWTPGDWGRQAVPGQVWGCCVGQPSTTLGRESHFYCLPVWPVIWWDLRWAHWIPLQEEEDLHFAVKVSINHQYILVMSASRIPGGAQLNDIKANDKCKEQNLKALLYLLRIGWWLRIPSLSLVKILTLTLIWHKGSLRSCDPQLELLAGHCEARADFPKHENDWAFPNQGGQTGWPPSLPLWRSLLGPLTSTESAIMPLMPAEANRHNLRKMQQCWDILDQRSV